MNEKPPKNHILIGCQKRTQNDVFLFEKSLKSPFCATTPNFMHTSEICRTAPKRENPAGPRSESLRDTKTSLGLAQKSLSARFRTRKPRWASLRIAPRRENLAGPRSESPRDAKTSLGLAQNRPETRKPRWASLRIAPRRENLAGPRLLQNCVICFFCGTDRIHK